MLGGALGAMAKADQRQHLFPYASLDIGTESNLGSRGMYQHIFYRYAFIYVLKYEYRFSD